MTDIYKMVHEISVKVNKETNDAVLGVIQSIAKENGMCDEFVLNENAITQALLKSQKRKVIIDRESYPYCPACRSGILNSLHMLRPSYCPICGQALDWEV